jgi:ion channel
MLRQFALGGVVSAWNITIHALVMTVVVRVALRASTKHTSKPSLRLTWVMIATVTVLMASHAAEVIVLYFAFVNYTTLGYGDVTPVDDWKLLGPLTAMNGVLLFGWSTAVIFEVLRRTMAGGYGIAASG